MKEKWVGPTWEYLIKKRDCGFPAPVEESIEEYINTLGTRGWELVNSFLHGGMVFLVFKRRKA